MNYRKITSSIASKLTLPETYTFFCIATKSDFETMESYVNEDTLAALEGVDIRTIQRHIKSIKDSRLANIEMTKHKKNGKFFRKNKYTLSTNNYVLISTDLTQEDISRELKGFLILLKTQCFNHTSLCAYSTQELADQLALSKTTINRYLNEAVDKKYIRWNKKEQKITILRKDLFIETNGKDNGINYYL